MSEDVKFSYAPDAERIARDLIDDYHPHLQGIRIDYIFRSKAKERKGKVTLAEAKKISGLPAWMSLGLIKRHLGTAAKVSRAGKDISVAFDDLTEAAIAPPPFFVIEIAEPAWEQLNDKQRKALIDHELCHCWVDDKGNLAMLAHDVEEFSAVVSRHGCWVDDLERFVKLAAEQLELAV